MVPAASLENLERPIQPIILIKMNLMMKLVSTIMKEAKLTTKPKKLRLLVSLLNFLQIGYSLSVPSASKIV